MLHAYRNPVRVFQFDDLTMLIGADAARRVLGLEMATYEGAGLIVHAMPARPRDVPEVTIMPRSVHDILDRADELAKRFEDYEPSADDEVGIAEHLLRRAAMARARSERQISEAVGAARRPGTSWKRIGVEVGISARAAHQRYVTMAKSA